MNRTHKNQTQQTEPHEQETQTPLSQQTVERLLAAIRARDIRIGANTLSPEASAGIAGIPGLDLSPEEVQIESDLTTGRARAKKAGPKKAGQEDDARTSSPHPPALEGRVKLGDRIRAALDNDLLQLLCEPVVCLHTRSVVRWQVLVQLVHTEGWLLPPASFVAAAERFGLADRLDSWVVSRAIELLRRQQGTDPELRLEVSISPKSLSSSAFVNRLEGAIASSGIAPECLIFGIPASAPTDIALAARFSERLSGLGCRFALENFGTGPTPVGGLVSLLGNAPRLAELPIASVKIDGRLVRHLTADASNRALIEGIARLAAGLEIKSVAMGVSNEATVELLRECGVDHGAGRHLGRPLPMMELP